MWRILLIAILWLAAPTVSRAQEGAQDWQVCRSRPVSGPPQLYDCRPIEGVIDPQGRELWLRSVVRRSADAAPSALYIVGVASSEAWLNGQRLGTNGRPGGTRSTETAGHYEAALPIPERMWRAGDNELVVHMSSFHGTVRLDTPIAGIMVAPWPSPARTQSLAIAFIAAGALFAAAFGFGVIHSLRRTSSSLTLALLAGAAALQAILESLRALLPYAYPIHGLRLVGIWGLTAAFAVLLVSYVASRFWPSARGRIIGIAVVAVVATYLAPGFDLKAVLALMIGLGMSAALTAIGVYRRVAGARLMLGYLCVCLVVGAKFPTILVDLSYFLFAAGLLLPLLMAEVVRLGRNDQQREAALTDAVTRPNCVTVVSSKRVERVPIANIVAIVGADDYVELRLSDGRNLLHAARLDRLEADLPASFLRIHRSAIANLDHAIGLERDGGRGRLLIRDWPALPISRNRLAAVREALDDTIHVGAKTLVTEGQRQSVD